ncbi:MAG: hypothetical protein R3D85_00965 [Paracoccaceae bacterium]
MKTFKHAIGALTLAVALAMAGGAQAQWGGSPWSGGLGGPWGANPYGYGYNAATSSTGYGRGCWQWLGRSALLG